MDGIEMVRGAVYLHFCSFSVPSCLSMYTGAYSERTV